MASGGSPDDTAIGQLQASNRTLHVGGLHQNTTEDELLEALGGTQAGIQSIRIARDCESQVSLGHARVEYASVDLVQKAIETYNFKTLRGLQLRLSLYKCVRDRIGTSETKVFIKNLDTNVSDRQLFDHLRTLGQRVETCQIYRNDKTGASRGYGVITYSSVADAAAAIEALNGTKLFTRQISVVPFKKRDPPAQVGGPSSSDGRGGGNLTTLYVSNLGPSTGDRELRDMFEKFGEVSSVRVLVSASGEPRGRGYVSFLDPRAAVQALASFSSSTTPRVAKATSRRERQALATRTLEALSGFTWLAVRNLDGSANDTTLSKVFGHYGKLVQAKVVFALNGAQCGFGYVQYESAEAAQKALRAYDSRQLGQPWVVEPTTAKPPELRINVTAEEALPNSGMISGILPASCSSAVQHLSPPPSVRPKVRAKVGHMMEAYMKDIGEFGHLSDGGSFDSCDLDYDGNPEISAEAGTTPDARRDENIRRVSKEGGRGREGEQRVSSSGQMRAPSPSTRPPARPAGRPPARSTERSQERQAGPSQFGPTVRSAERSAARPPAPSAKRSAERQPGPSQFGPTVRSAERSAARPSTPSAERSAGRQTSQPRRGRAEAAVAASQARPRPPLQQASQQGPVVQDECAPAPIPGTDHKKTEDRSRPVTLEDQLPTTLRTAPKSPIAELAEDVASAASKEEKLRLLGNFMYLALHDRYDCEGATGLLVAKFLRLDDVDKLMSMCRDKVLLYTEAEAAANTLRLSRYYSNVTANIGAAAAGTAAGGAAAAAGRKAAATGGAAAAAKATGRAAPAPPLPKTSGATVNSKSS